MDGLAKLAATNEATTHQEACLVASAEHLVKHCAGQLAVATHAANNYVEHYLDEKGVRRTRTKRDSQDIPRSAPRKLQPLKALEKPPAATPPAVPDPLDSGSESEVQLSMAQRRRAARNTAKKKERAQQKAPFQLIVEPKRLNQREAALARYRT